MMMRLGDRKWTKIIKYMPNIIKFIECINLRANSDKMDQRSNNIHSRGDDHSEQCEQWTGVAPSSLNLASVSWQNYLLFWTQSNLNLTRYDRIRGRSEEVFMKEMDTSTTKSLSSRLYIQAMCIHLPVPCLLITSIQHFSRQSLSIIIREPF